MDGSGCISPSLHLCVAEYDDGYYYITKPAGTPGVRTQMVHRCIGLLWPVPVRASYGPWHIGMTINHKKDAFGKSNKKNNAVDMLEWVPHAVNSSEH